MRGQNSLTYNLCMAKTTLMIRFRRPEDKGWIRKRAVLGTTGQVKSGLAQIKDDHGVAAEVDIGDRYTYQVKIERNGKAVYKPVGGDGRKALSQFREIATKVRAGGIATDAGLVVADPTEATAAKVKLEDAFDDYIADCKDRNALEAREQAVLVKAEFIKATCITYVDEVTRERILSFDVALRAQGRGDRTIANKRQRLQSMLRWAKVDPSIFPPKPRYEEQLPTIYSTEQLSGLFSEADRYQKMVISLALKLGLRDQEVQFAEFGDIDWEGSVFRVLGKPKCGFTVKDYEQRDIPIPRDLLLELREWKSTSTGTLIVPTGAGKPNSKLLRMIKRLARRAGVTCGVCPNCASGAQGDSGCDEFELHKFRRTCITTWLRNGIDPRTVMAYAGHKDLETTLRYLRPAAAPAQVDAVSNIRWF
jgi:integrase